MLQAAIQSYRHGQFHSPRPPPLPDGGQWRQAKGLRRDGTGVKRGTLGGRKPQIFFSPYIYIIYRPRRNYKSLVEHCCVRLSGGKFWIHSSHTRDVQRRPSLSRPLIYGDFMSLSRRIKHYSTLLAAVLMPLILKFLQINLKTNKKTKYILYGPYYGDYMSLSRRIKHYSTL